MFENWGTILIFVKLLGNIPLHISSCYLGQLAYWKNLSGLVYITWSPYLYKCGTGKNFVIHSPLIKDKKVKHVFLGKQNLLKSLSFFYVCPPIHYVSPSLCEKISQDKVLPCLMKIAPSTSVSTFFMLTVQSPVIMTSSVIISSILPQIPTPIQNSSAHSI